MEMRTFSYERNIGHSRCDTCGGYDSMREKPKALQTQVCKNCQKQTKFKFDFINKKYHCDECGCTCWVAQVQNPPPQKPEALRVRELIKKLLEMPMDNIVIIRNKNGDEMNKLTVDSREKKEAESFQLQVKA
jgi:hypothetical protein